MRGLLKAAALTASVALLAACAQIPTAGPVEEGVADPAEVTVPLPIAQGPVEGASPQQIVSGFLEAAAAGVVTDFDAARTFLTESAAATWNPSAGVSVYPTDLGVPAYDEASAQVTVAVPVTISVDVDGQRTDNADVEDTTLAFSLITMGGEWRISDLADGVVVSTSQFTRYFEPVNLYFATPARDMAVPDLRWLPDRNTATSVTRELIAGPAEWLADAVDTGFLPGAQLAVESVVVEGGVAAVELSPGAVGSEADRNLVFEQLRLTLTQLPSVSSVEVSVGSLPLVTTDPPALPTAPETPSALAVVVENQLGLFSEGELLLTAPSAGGLPTSADQVALAYDGTTIAFTAGTGALGVGAGVFVTEALGGSLQAPSDESTTGFYPSERVYAAQDAVSPSFDRYGAIWTGSAAGGEIASIAADGGETLFAPDWLSGRQIVSLAVSPAASRLVIATRASGEVSVQVVAIVRDESGTPVSLSIPLLVAVSAEDAFEVDWDTEVAVAVAVADEDDTPVSQVWLSRVGGDTSSIATPTAVADMAVHGGEQAMAYVDDDLIVRWRTDGAWSEAFEGARSVAFAG